uniref:Uncharacterized protein n=1 Tax=Arundo donax TaxID=35708 RepID=A0A0A9AI79_ARUDO
MALCFLNLFLLSYFIARKNKPSRSLDSSLR